MARVSLTLEFPSHLPSADRSRLTALAERNLADHGDGFVGLVLSGSAGRGIATDRSDLDVFVVLSDDAAPERTTAHSPDVDEIPWSRSELETVGAFGTEEWWSRWSCAWAPVVLDRTGGDLAGALHRQATLTPDEADAVLIAHERLDGWVNFAYRSLKNDRDGRVLEARLDAAESVPWLLDVVFAIDRAGLVGADGMTHQGVYDLAFLRPVPGLQIATPKDARELRGVLRGALERGGPVAVRWPRGGVVPAPDAPVEAWEEVPWGTWEVVKDGTDVAVLAFGATLPYALTAAGDDPRVAVVNARFVKPLDTAMLERLAGAGTPLVTVEDHVLHGGFGAAVAEFLSDRGGAPRLVRLGIDDRHVPHGDPAAQHEALGYGPEGIRAALARLGFGPAAAVAVAERR